MTLQVNKDHYNFSDYVTKKRWMSLWYQAHEILELSPSSVLEVGVGSGILKTIIKSLGVKVSTLDIDPELEPDIISSVTDIKSPPNQYDVVVAFQVLEHLPYESFSSALKELKKVSKKHVIISLPDARNMWRYTFHIPKVGERSCFIKRPNIFLKKHRFDGQHYWEINKKGFDQESIYKTIENEGFKILKSYRAPENTYHHFFILEKKT